VSIASALRDRTVRKVAKYGVPVAIGKLAASLSGLVTLGILTRHLGPTKFGVIALYRSVVAVIDLYANFNTWQAIIKYGTEQIAAGKPDELRRIIKLAFSIDISTGWLGLIVVAGLAFAIPGTFGWTTHEAALCAIYGITLVSKVAGTSDGIYRVCDAYRVQAIVSSIGAAVMTLLVVVFVACGAGFDGCVYALVLGEVLSNIATTTASFWVAQRNGYGGWLRSSVRGIRRDHPGLVRFLVATNAQLTVRTTQSELDMIVVGSMLGKAEAGLYRVVKQLGTIPGKVFMPFEQVLFTELARCAAAHDYRGFRALLRRTVSLAAVGALAIWLVTAFGARLLIHLVAGDAFIAAAEPFRWYMLAMALHVSAAPVMRAMIALGRPGTLLAFDCASLVVLASAVVSLGLEFGLLGVSLAIVVHKAVQLAWSTTWIIRHVAALERGTKTSISTTNT
jgi:O-antigen/teichoic acid export membrane protein